MERTGESAGGVRRVVTVDNTTSRGGTAAVPLWNIANVLTIIRVVLVPVFAVTLFVDSGQALLFRLLAAGIFAVAAITERFDGELARNRGVITDFEKNDSTRRDTAHVVTVLIG